MVSRAEDLGGKGKGGRIREVKGDFLHAAGRRPRPRFPPAESLSEDFHIASKRHKRSQFLNFSVLQSSESGPC